MQRRPLPRAGQGQGQGQRQGLLLTARAARGTLQALQHKLRDAEERSRSRVMLLDQKGRVLASSDGRGVLTEVFPLNTSDGPMGSYADGDLTVGYALTPGYETYKGLGWYGCLAQTKQPASIAETMTRSVAA